MCLFLSSNNMHFRDMIQYLLKSREKFVLLSSLLETDPDQENKWYMQCLSETICIN